MTGKTEKMEPFRWLLLFKTVEYNYEDNEILERQN